MCLEDEMVRVRVFASSTHIWHMPGVLTIIFNMACAIKFRLAKEGLKNDERHDYPATYYNVLTIVCCLSSKDSMLSDT